MSLIALLILLQIKHFVCDFPLQKPFQYLNKGKWMHPGGLLHSSLHAFGTLIALVLVGASFILCMSLALLDFVIHYLVDYSKVNLNNRYGWKPDNSEYFWWLLGFDQLLHQLTYVFIIWMVV